MPFFLYVEMQLNCSLVYWVIVFVFLGGGGGGGGGGGRGLLDFFPLVRISYDFWPQDCFVLVFKTHSSSLAFILILYITHSLMIS